MARYTAEQLRAMPTLKEGYADNLKIKTDDTEVWLSRATVADGAPYDNGVTVKRKGIDGNWYVSAEYPG